MKETNNVIPLQKAFNYAFEIRKDAIDPSKRIIEGFATTEDIDREDQIVDLKAVEKALNMYLKNPTVRADHRPPPIGETLIAEPRQVNGNKGLFVQVQIGKNTRATDEAWSLIEQGLYKAFSIGGQVRGMKNLYNKSAKRHIQHVTDILISEISVTDAPANQSCMFAVISKSLDATDFQGDIPTLIIWDYLTKKVGPWKDFEACVTHLMGDPDFKPRGEYATKREAAQAVCASIESKQKALGLEVKPTMSEPDLSKQLENIDTRFKALEEGQAETTKSIEDIKELLTKQAPDHEETEEEKKKREEKEKKEEAKKAASEDLSLIPSETLKKSLEQIGFTFPEEPQRAALQNTTPGETPPTDSKTPLTLNKMFQARYGPLIANKEEGGQS